MQKDKLTSTYCISNDLTELNIYLDGLGADKNLKDGLAAAIRVLNEETFNSVIHSNDSTWISALVQVKPGKNYSRQGRSQLELEGLVQTHMGVKQFTAQVDWTSSGKILYKSIGQKIKVAATYKPETSKWHEFIHRDQNISIGRMQNVYINQNIQNTLRVITQLPFESINFSANNPVVLPFDIDLVFSKVTEHVYQAAVVLDSSRIEIFQVKSQVPPEPYLWRKGEKLPWEMYNFSPHRFARLLSICITNEIHKKTLQAKSQCINAFVKTLDQDIYTHLTEMKVDGVNSHYNWIMQAPTARIKERRWQALKAAPVLISSCITSIRGNEDSDSPDIDKDSSYYRYMNAFNFKGMEQTVDGAKELIPLFCDRLGVSTKFIREIAAVKTDVDQISRMLKDNLEITLRIGKFLPTNSVPKQLDEWKKFFIFLSTCRYLLNTNNHLLVSENCKIFSKEANWLWQKKTLLGQSIVNVDDFARECGKLTGINDLSMSFARQCIFPLVIDELVKHGSKVDWDDLNDILHLPYKNALILEHVLIRDHTLSQLLEMSDYWHKHRQTIEAQGVSLDQRWPPLFEPFEINGLMAIPLCSPQELEDEGKAMNHCVATYARYCLWGKSHIVGLRDLSGNRVSTMEIKIREEKDEDYIDIEQHLSFKNSQPSEQAKQAAQSIIEGISRRNIQVQWQELEDALASRKKEQQAEKIINLVGYDIRNLKLREQVFTAWSFTQPNNLKGNYQEWIDQTGLREMINQIVSKQVSDKVQLMQAVAQLNF